MHTMLHDSHDSLLLPRPLTPTGGALAHLAAFDVQHYLSLAPDQVGVHRVCVHALACVHVHACVDACLMP